jgi:hypothetical protein
MMELTLASKDDEALAKAASGWNGQLDHLKILKDHPLARSELDIAVKRFRRRRTSVDHIHLSQCNGTELVQWLGRFSSGYHHPLGRLMKIIGMPLPAPPKQTGDE